MQRIRKFLMWPIVIIFVLVFVVVPYTISFMMTNPGTRPMDRNRTETPATYGADYQEISFLSGDGIELRGWYLPSRDKHATVILAHGRFRSRMEMLREAILLWKAGYGALLFDFRRHGESSGKHSTFGYYERFDVEGAVRLVRERLNPTDRIVPMGRSMGAATVLLAAAETPQVDAVISDSTFLSFESTIAHHTKLFFHLPAFPIANEIVFITEHRMGFDKENFNMEEAVKRIGRRPILFIAGGADRRMPPEIAEHLYAIARSPRKALLIIPDARHGMTYHTNPSLYEKEVLAFLNQALNDRAGQETSR